MGTKWVVILTLIMMSAGCAVFTRELYVESIQEIPTEVYRIVSVDTIDSGREKFYRAHVIVKKR